MDIAKRIFSFAFFVMISLLITPFLYAQAPGSGAYAAGINYPAGPPTSPTNTNFYLGGISPLEIHYGDFNGDSKLDVIAASNCGYYPFNAWCPINGSIIVVYLNNGDGTFQAPILSGLTLPTSIRSMAVGDFNGDGKLDVAVGDDGGASGGDLTLLLGNGDGTFTQSYQTAVNGIFSQAGTLAVGDFNGDGKLDLAVGLACFNLPVNGCGVGAVSIYLGNGDGTLSGPTNYNTVGNSALYPVVGDFNNDGHLDIIAGSAYAPGGNRFNSSLTVLLGNGDGTFSQPANDQVTLPFSGLSALTSADFNADGKFDLAITTYPASIQVLSGNGDGTFQSPVAYTSALSNRATNTTAVVVTDLNNDGKPDLVISGTLGGNNGVQLYLNDGTGNFIVGPTYGLGGWEFAPIVAQDFNGDGKIDIVMASTLAENGVGPASDGTLSVLFGNGDGTMQGATVFNQSPLSTQSNTTIVADLNGDGIPDLVQVAFNFDQTHTQGGVAVSLGTGNGSYGPPVLYPTGSPNSFWVVAGDFNGDGKLDLAVANACSDGNCTQGGVAILLGNGDGTFQAPTVYGSGAPLALTLVTGDFNGDGKLDVAVMNQDQPPSVGILLGNGDGTLQPAVLTNTSAGVTSNYSIAAGDFNGDGKTDVALVSISTDQSTGLIAIYLSNGDGTLTQEGTSFSSGGTARSGGFGMSLAVADVNNDGKLDVVVANSCQILNSNCSAGTLSVFIGNGDGTFQSGPSQTVPDGNFYSLFLADINGDGILDAIATNLTGVAVFPGKADGSFLAPTVYAGVSTGGENMSLALADLNIIQPSLSNGLNAILVNKAGTYLVSQSSANPSSGNQSIQLTTTASASYLTGVTPTGTVSYYDGTKLLGSAALVGGTATMNMNGLSAGVDTITSYYSGDLNFNAHYGTPLLQVVTTSFKKAQTITFTLSSSTLTYGSAPIPLSATASSGLPVAFLVISGPGAVSGNSLTVTGAGTIVIEADQAGNSAYSAASPVQQTLTVSQASAVITWANPPAITYGTVLSSVQLDATASVPGNFVYSPAVGALLGAGTQTLSATFTPTDTTDYTTATGTATLVVNKAIPTVSFTGAPGTAGYLSTFLVAATTNATSVATVAAAGACNLVGNTVTMISGTGVCNLSANWVADSNYLVSSAAQNTTATKVAPTIAFTGAPSTAGFNSSFTVSATTNASTTAAIAASGACSITGATVTISAPSGTCSLSVTWAADNNYLAASATQYTAATKAMPTINWTAPRDITYGTTLSGTQLDATATYNGAILAGTFAYTPAKGAVLTVGTQTLSVTFTPSKAADYASASASVTLQVGQATPKITWPKPAAITYGTELSSTQLDATASVPGTLVYSPPTSTVLDGGAQTLSVTFSPTDSTDYATASKSVTLTVTKGSTATSVSEAPSSSLLGQLVTFSATVISSSGITPTGSIVFRRGATVLGTVPLDATGLATFTTSVLSVGSYAVTASYSATTDFGTSLSTSVTETVSKLPAATSVSSSSDPSTLRTRVTFTATVGLASGVNTSFTGSPTGLVTFYDGTKRLGTGTLSSSGVTTFSIATLTHGAHNITAVYSGDANFVTGTSGVLVQTVN
jgi:hypothetical protein